MTEKIIRPNWLKILIGVFTTWTMFLITMAIFLIVVWIIQIKILDIEISGIPALIILLAELIVSIYISYRLTKWQNSYMDKKSLRFNYIILIILIILSFIFIPAPMTYMIF